MKLMKFMILRCILKCIIKNCKPPQSFDFTETKLLLKFIWFEKVSMSLLPLLDERIKSILCLLLYLLIKIEVLAWNIFTKSHIKHDRQKRKDSNN